MPAYALVEAVVHDYDTAMAYNPVAVASIEQYGGRYLVRGDAKVHPVEGDWPDGRRTIVLEFPDLEQAQRWYASPEYAEAIEIRRDAMEVRLLLVEGV